jgi:predicted esterase
MYYLKQLINTLKRILFLFFFLFADTVFTSAQDLGKPVQYLSKAPVLDGFLDSNLNHLHKRQFPHENKSKPTNKTVNPHYRLAYGVDFFYVYLEAEADSFIFRDRAYQNGDGFHMVLGKSQKDNAPTDEFYVLAGSAVDNPRMEWSRRFFWYYNVYTIFKRPSENTNMQFSQRDNTISFELFLPWADVKPYHPWISDSIGFNLAFVKAFPQFEKTYYTVLNSPLGRENSKREYLNLEFESPQHSGNTGSFLSLTNNKLYPNEALKLKALSVSENSSSENIRISIKSGEDERLSYQTFTYQTTDKPTKKEFTLRENGLPPGGYQVSWTAGESNAKGTEYFTVLPESSKHSLTQTLNTSKKNISESSYYSLQFKINELFEDLEQVKPYETCGKQRIALFELSREIHAAEKGIDPIEKKRNFVRKAYKSEIDGKLLPYMLHIPENYDPNKKYPLLVFLHGSASDETSLKHFKDRIPGDFIALAPNGRGTSNCYSWNHAQDDIRESVNATLNTLSIDEDNIILAGFSMGGYGVYRTYIENPDRFKALAVFSGHPNLANKWSGENSHPDFTKAQFLKKFKDVPIFIFHGKQDRNCAFEITENIITILQKEGAKVSFISEDDKGHEKPSAETVEKFKLWLSRITENS